MLDISHGIIFHLLPQFFFRLFKFVFALRAFWRAGCRDNWCHVSYFAQSNYNGESPNIKFKNQNSICCNSLPPFCTLVENPNVFASVWLFEMLYFGKYFWWIQVKVFFAMFVKFLSWKYLSFTRFERAATQTDTKWRTVSIYLAGKAMWALGTYRYVNMTIPM